MTSQTAAAFLTTEEASARSGIPAGVLRHWRHAQSSTQGPPHIKIGKQAMYPADLLDQFIQQLRDRAAAGA
jgi:hypothetical protein